MSVEQAVTLTIVIMTILFGGSLLFCLARYGRPIRKYDGFLDILREDSRMINRIEITTPPSHLEEQDRIVLKVRKVKLPVPLPTENLDNS